MKFSNVRALRRSGPIAAVMAAGLVLSACGSSGSADAAEKYPDAIIDTEACERNAAAGTITYISGYGFSASAGQMDVFIAKELGYFDDLCLDVEINAAGADGQQLVASGQAEFTELGSAADVIMAASNSKNLTAVATYGTTSPFSIFTNEDIKSLKDLEGGTLGYFINITPVALAMLDAAGVDQSKVELVKMTNYDPTVVTRGQVDAIVGYASNQVESLKAADLPFGDFRPDDFDLGGTYNVMEVNSKFLAENREVVADFMRASLKALEHCLEDEADCVQRVTDLAEEANQGEAFPLEQQERTWKVESQWVRDNATGAPGVISAEAWEQEAEIVEKYGNVDEILPIEDMIDADLVAELYDDNNNLIWPGDK